LFLSNDFQNEDHAHIRMADSFAAVAQRVSAEWNSMTDEQKAPYKALHGLHDGDTFKDGAMTLSKESPVYAAWQDAQRDEVTIIHTVTLTRLNGDPLVKELKTSLKDCRNIEVLIEGFAKLFGFGVLNFDKLLTLKGRITEQESGRAF